MTHFDIGQGTTTSSTQSASGPWYRDMTRYHWFVFTVAALGWLFDCLDQQLFTLARMTAIRHLLDVPAGDPSIAEWVGYATTIFMLGWATGGLVFGALGDRIGRVKTMLITILVYSICTGLSALAQNVYDFSAYRFLTGLGVGGEFAVGVALIAEVMPENARARALSLLQAFSAIGNISAALISLALAPWEATGVETWRTMFAIGAIPALLAIFVRRQLKEPERWQTAASHQAQDRGSYRALFANPSYRRSALIGLCLAIPGVIGLWGIGFFSGDLTRMVLRSKVSTDVFQALQATSDDASDPALVRDTIKKLEGWERSNTPKQERTALSAAEKPIADNVEAQISSRLSKWQSYTMILLNIGAFFGMYSFGWLAQLIGRRPTFLIAFLGAMCATINVFHNFNGIQDYWMIFVMGYFLMSLFAGYAIYLPELFPTHLRSTGTSFCYNVGRYVAAFGPTLFGLLTSMVFVGPKYAPPMNWRWAGISMTAIFLFGIVTLLFARETRNQPLPE
jgi:MFS family permease